MDRDLTPDDLVRIANFGAFGYGADRCAAILGWDAEEVEREMNDSDSKFAKEYEKGRTRAEYVIDLKLFDQAQAGDIKSLDKLERRKQERRRGRR